MTRYRAISSVSHCYEHFRCVKNWTPFYKADNSDFQRKVQFLQRHSVTACRTLHTNYLRRNDELWKTLGYSIGETRHTYKSVGQPSAAETFRRISAGKIKSKTLWSFRSKTGAWKRNTTSNLWKVVNESFGNKSCNQIHIFSIINDLASVVEATECVNQMFALFFTAHK